MRKIIIFGMLLVLFVFSVSADTHSVTADEIQVDSSTSLRADRSDGDANKTDSDVDMKESDADLNESDSDLKDSSIEKESDTYDEKEESDYDQKQKLSINRNVGTHAEGRVILTVNGEEFYTNARVVSAELSGALASDARCGFSRGGEIVCEVTPVDGTEQRSDDNSIYCWGKNELRECPRTEIVPGQGAGKVSIGDISLSSRSSGDDTIEVLSWSWGSSSASRTTDPDDDTAQLSYVWFVSGEPASSDRPVETLSLSFTKLEMGFSGDNGNDGIIEIEIPDMKVHANSLLFTTVSFSELVRDRDDAVCGTTDHLIMEGDCNDEDASVRPGIAVDVDRDDSNQTGLSDVSADVVENISSDLSRDEDSDSLEIEQRGGISGYIDKSTPVLFSAGQGVTLDESDKDEIREYLSTLTEFRGRDLGLSITILASENPRIREVIYHNDTNVVEIEHDEEVRLLGFIRMNVNSRTTVHEDGTEETKRPWWTFLARKSEVRFKAGADLSGNVN